MVIELALYDRSLVRFSLTAVTADASSSTRSKQVRGLGEDRVCEVLCPGPTSFSVLKDLASDDQR